MKRPTTKRPLTPAEERRLFTEGTAVPVEEETAGVKRRKGMGVRELEARRGREEGVKGKV